MHARSAKNPAASAPQNPAPSVVAATPSSSNTPEPAPIAPKVASKEAARQRPKRNAPKAVVKAAEATTKDERRVSAPPAAPANKKPSREHVFLAFAALIGVAALIAYFATRKPSPPPLQEDKPIATATQKAAEKPADVAPFQDKPTTPTPVVIAPPPTSATADPQTITPAVPTDKPAPVEEPFVKKSNDPPTKNAPSPKPTPAPTQAVKIAPKKPAPVKGDDYE
jgi:hypothetical protein